MSIFIAIIFAVVLWLSFMAIINQFKNESREELKNQYFKENSFQEMFDGLQEGIIVMKGEKIHFMNELSKKLISILPKINKDNKDITGINLGDKLETIREVLLSAKMFYAFDNSLKSSDKKKQSSTDSSSKRDGKAKNKKIS